MSLRPYYVRGEVVPFEEDFTHEFKGHRNICIEDLPPWTRETPTERASRQAVSRAINAFLNTGKGGTVYLGVIDSGVVRGMQLSEFQKEHVRASLEDLMTRYHPPVKPHRYITKFVPIVDNKLEGEKYLKTDQPYNQEDDIVQRPHELRTSNYCWCDKDTNMRFNAGIIPKDYIIEIKVLPWDPEDPLNRNDGCGSLTNIHPIHDDEEGNCYFRRQASLVKYTMSMIAQMSRQEAQESCLEKIDRLRKEVAALEQASMEDTSGS